MGNSIGIRLIIALTITMSIPLLGGIITLVRGMFVGISMRLLGRKMTYFLFNRLTFIGVFHHELSHALWAVITGAKVRKIVFFKPQGDMLGYVEFVPRGNFVFQAIQQTITAIAPVFCGMCTIGGLVYVLSNWTLPIGMIVFLYYCIASVFIHMTMSAQDVRIMWRGMPIVYLLVLVCLSIFK